MKEFKVEVDNKTCRYCLEDSTEDTYHNLISPCKCSGSQKYVHKNCLLEWIISNNSDRDIEPGYFNNNDIKCEVCQTKYRFVETILDVDKKSCRYHSCQLIKVLFMYISCLIVLGLIFTRIPYLNNLFEADTESVLAHYLYGTIYIQGLIAIIYIYILLRKREYLSWYSVEILGENINTCFLSLFYIFGLFLWPLYATISISRSEYRKNSNKILILDILEYKN
jgi:hypothetical protein